MKDSRHTLSLNILINLERKGDHTKVSCYNLYFPLKDRYIVYNTLKDSITVADKELYECLKTSALQALDEKVQQSLFRCGVLVPDDTDERVVLRYLYQQAKYSAEFISILLLPTYACNLSCHYCPHPSQQVFMSPQTARSVILFLRNLIESTNLGVVLKLYGGEPLLNEQCCLTMCEELSSFCQSRGVPFLAAAMTNGTLLTHKKTEKVLDYLGAIHVTLDGSQEYHNRVRHHTTGKGTYEDIMEGLSLAREKTMRISVRVNITAENLDSVGELLEDLRKRKLDEYEGFDIYFGPLAPLEECTYFKDDASMRTFKEETFSLVPRLREIIQAAGWKGRTRDSISDVRGISKPELCLYSKAHNFVIGPLGELYTCPGFVGDSDYCTGSLNPDGTVEFNPLYFDIHTRDCTQLECADCEYMPLCGGGCPVRAHMRNKTVDSHYCGTLKEVVEMQMLLYLQYTRPDLFEGGVK